jgi:hypothetical protein
MMREPDHPSCGESCRWSATAANATSAIPISIQLLISGLRRAGARVQRHDARYSDLISRMRSPSLAAIMVVNEGWLRGIPKIARIKRLPSMLSPVAEYNIADIAKTYLRKYLNEMNAW